MTIRGLVCVYYRGRFAVAMRTACSYPQGDGEGMGVLRFLWKPGNIERLREGLQYVATPTPEIYGLGIATGADLLNIIAQATAKNYTTIRLDLDFATSGWCDWAYIVDLDRNTFDVFGDDEPKREAPTTRFSDLGGDGDKVTVPALLQSFSFSQLPATEEEFIRGLEAGRVKEMYYAGWEHAGWCREELKRRILSINEEEEADKPLEEGTGGMGNTNNAIEVEK
ncbi:hypothetical protein V8E54_010057 [Elaphomyces granulatus]